MDAASNPSLSSEAILSLEPSLPKLSPIENLEAIRIRLDKEIEDRKVAKRCAELVESERLLKEKVASLKKEITALKASIACSASVKAPGQNSSAAPVPAGTQAGRGWSQFYSEKHIAEITELKTKLEEQNARIAELERESELKEPLFQVGVDVRVGCLELAAKAHWNSFNFNEENINNRNIAAHEGNWKADSALITLGYIDLEVFYDETEDPQNLWEYLYYADPWEPHRKLTVPTKFVQALDYRFTILTSGSKLTEAEFDRREMARALTHFLVDIWPSKLVVNKTSAEVETEYASDARVVKHLHHNPQIIVNYIGTKIYPDTNASTVPPDPRLDSTQ
ncbi:hypothetical protein IFR05_013134 [Cadophora sp. M221]|nr:hypothetical protein IFR05_013134 [Cadophora sp. M221]